MNANEAIGLLKKCIAIPSFSREEKDVSDLLFAFIGSKGYEAERLQNNLIIKSKHWQEGKPVLLLNSHMDTVKPTKNWTVDPFNPEESDGKLFGLGSNDAGGCLVSLLATFFNLDAGMQPYNLLFVASAEEELSGVNGMEILVPSLPHVDFALVGEPTQMQMAIAEKGLMVLDCVANGKAGHAARNEGVNAIYNALADIEWFRSFRFPKESEVLGPVKMTVTQINAGYQHNVVPDKCEFVVDVRSNECYRNQELFEIIKKHIASDIKARSFRLNSSSVPENHPVVVRGKQLGRICYGSPTTSDQALMPYVSMKMGPGDSARSHTADEFIYLYEIEQAIDLYFKLLDGLILC